MEMRAVEAPRALEHYAEELRGIARAQLGPPLRSRLDPSDVVQQTLLIAYQRRAAFRGATHAELRRWLRVILDRTLALATRRRGRFPAEQARSLERSPDSSAARPMDWLAGDQSTPSQRADRKEQWLRLAAAMAALPADQRTALELHHFESMPVADVAARMGRTVPAVAGLLYRGTRALRNVLS